MFDHYPISIIKLNLEEDDSLYAFFQVTKKGLIKTFYFLPTKDLLVNHSFVKVDSTTNISTISLSHKGKKSSTIFIKTPYLQVGPLNYYIHTANSLFNKGFNVVIQSNRGAHASNGDFKWLDDKNIEDSGKSIEWITKQGFSNGEVISYGTSYDGYNSLAAAASNAEGLVSSIACSAPANVETDSFSAGKIIEERLLSFIAEREGLEVTNLFHEKFRYLQSIDTPYSEFDDLLYERDIADWSDLIAAKETGKLDNYFGERSLLEKLSTSKVPVFHIAGSDNDQDGRDSVLAYEYLKNESHFPNNHFLYLHHGGHGCGPFLDKDFARKFLDGNFKEIQNEYRDHSSSGHTSGDILTDFTDIELDLAPADEISKLNNRSELEEAKSLQFGKIIDKDLVVNGPLKLSFFAKSSLSKSSISISIFKSEDGDWVPLHAMASRSSRVSLYFEDSSEGEYSAVLPPMFFKLKKGEALLISLSAENDGFIDFFEKERRNYYEKNHDAGFFEVLGSNIQLTLPIEVERVD